MYGADPNEKHPMPGFPQICFIRNTVTNPQIEIGEYAYYDDPVGGNPAQLIRHRFTPEIIAALLEIAWWHWNRAKITRNLDKIIAADLNALSNCE